MPTLATLRDMTYAYLGTTSSNQQLTIARVDRWLNDAYNALVEDLPGSFLISTATLTADSSTSRTYTLTSQATPITDWRQFREVRLTNNEGVILLPVDYDQLRILQGDTYSVRGNDHALIVETSPGQPAGSALWVVYSTWPAEMSATSDIPSAIPYRYHDLIALGAAELGFASGGEGRFPAEYAARKQDRYAQFLDHVTRRGTDAPNLRLSA